MKYMTYCGEKIKIMQHVSKNPVGIFLDEIHM